MASSFPVPRLARTEAEPLLATIGNTPLLRLEKIQAEFPGIEIFGKAEYFNPGGSVKDRAALNMVLDGERSGKLNHNRTILDSTSGTTGIAYAMIGANRGYKVKLVLPGNASEERKRILKAYGAEMVFSDPNESSDGAIRPGFYDETMADGNLWIETEDAYHMVRRLAREEGLLVGISSGCNVYAATLLAKDLVARGESAMIV